jgi:hypothetical protein
MARPSVGDDPDAAAFLRALGRRIRLLRLIRELTQEGTGCPCRDVAELRERD